MFMVGSKSLSNVYLGGLIVYLVIVKPCLNRIFQKPIPVDEENLSKEKPKED